MRRPPLVIKPATAAQLPAIAAIHRTAFAPTLWFNSLWGKVDPAVFDEWFVNEAKAWLKTDHVLVAMRGEDILGYASWEEKSGPTEEAQSAEPTFPEGTNLPVALAFSRDMGNYTSSIKGRFWRESLRRCSGLASLG